MFSNKTIKLYTILLYTHGHCMCYDLRTYVFSRKTIVPELSCVLDNDVVFDQVECLMLDAILDTKLDN